MNISFTYVICFPPDDLEKEIEFTCEFSKGGIGAYEFWGQKCYDAGNWEIDNIEYDSADLTKEECKYIEENIVDSDKLIDYIWDRYNDL